MKRAICVGIDNYPGFVNDLECCVADATIWAETLRSFGFITTMITDSNATRKKILFELENTLQQSNIGDVVVFTYSGHGTSVLDQSGDEEDGYDEALYVYDDIILDDSLRAIISQTPKGVHIAVILDSCFSGTATRGIVLHANRHIETDHIPIGVLRKRKLLSDESMIEVLFSACDDSEYAYEGEKYGAFTEAVLQVIDPNQTYNELYEKVRELLPSREYPQTPQLEGSEANRNRIIFGSIEEEEMPPVDESEEEVPGDYFEEEPISVSPWWIIAAVGFIGFLIYLIFK